MVEGTVDYVPVTLGQQIKANDLLAVIHSREIGAAKLQLYQARMELELAQTKSRIQQEISKNAAEMIAALREGNRIEEIESKFRNKPMGDYRERALAAFSNYTKSQADMKRLEGVADSGAVSSGQLMTAEAARNADLATFQARIEQIEYELSTSALLAQQAVKEADAKVLVAATNLRILGCESDEIATVDPAKQGETLSHYSLRAPFDGTILTKDAVLREQVRPDSMLLSIADLSTVWVSADIYEEHLPLLQNSVDKSLTLSNKSMPDRTFEAKVFYTGDLMDEATRTIAMRAIAENPDHLLKPGMFVTIELPTLSMDDALAIPAAAVQQHEGVSFVFVYGDKDRFERRDVVVGPDNGTQVVIESGLEVGDKVVSKGGFILKSRLLAALMGEE